MEYGHIGRKTQSRIDKKIKTIIGKDTVRTGQVRIKVGDIFPEEHIPPFFIGAVAVRCGVSERPMYEPRR